MSCVRLTHWTCHQMLDELSHLTFGYLQHFWLPSHWGGLCNHLLSPVKLQGPELMSPMQQQAVSHPHCVIMSKCRSLLMPGDETLLGCMEFLQHWCLGAGGMISLQVMVDLPLLWCIADMHLTPGCSCSLNPELIQNKLYSSGLAIFTTLQWFKLWNTSVSLRHCWFLTCSCHFFLMTNACDGFVVVWVVTQLPIASVSHYLLWVFAQAQENIE